jgi:hypothetical protein
MIPGDRRSVCRVALGMRWDEIGKAFAVASANLLRNPSVKCKSKTTVSSDECRGYLCIISLRSKGSEGGISRCWSCGIGRTRSRAKSAMGRRYDGLHDGSEEASKMLEPRRSHGQRSAVMVARRKIWNDDPAMLSGSQPSKRTLPHDWFALSGNSW